MDEEFRISLLEGGAWNIDRGVKTAHTDQAATEEAGSQPLGDASNGVSAKQEPRRFLDLARRDLNEEELSSPAARRFLIAEIERLDGDCANYKATHLEFIDLKVENATLLEAQKKSRWNEILSFVCSTIGAAGIGAAPSYMTVAGLHGVGWVLAIGSAILVIVAVLSRLIK